MKKFLLILSVMLLTGCGNQLVCTKNSDEELYKTKEEIIFEFDENSKVTDTTVNYIMTFETEEDAKTYLSVFNSLKENYEIELNGKNIEISSTKNYEQYNGDKVTLKNELETDGYKCR